MRPEVSGPQLLIKDNHTSNYTEQNSFYLGGEGAGGGGGGGQLIIRIVFYLVKVRIFKPLFPRHFTFVLLFLIFLSLKFDFKSLLL